MIKPKGLKGSAIIHQESIDWVVVMDQYQSSGLSQKRFCLENGIPYGAFRNKLYRINMRDRQEEPLAKTPLFAPIVAQEVSPNPIEAPLIVEVSGLRIIVPPSFGSDTLQRLLGVVRTGHV